MNVHQLLFVFLVGTATACQSNNPPQRNPSRPVGGVAPVNPAPVNPAPVNPAPVNPAPVNPAPVNPAPVYPAPVNPAPVGR